MKKIEWPTAAAIVGTIAALACVSIFAPPESAKGLMTLVGSLGAALAGALRALVRSDA